MFILNCLMDHINYPKYLVLLYIDCINVYNTVFFYYLISNSKCFYFNKWWPISLKYINIPKLNFNLFNMDTKFNLNKLGTDYIFNDIYMHYRNECIGNYPENYIFVKEPAWPIRVENVIDKTPLKKKSNICL